MKNKKTKHKKNQHSNDFKSIENLVPANSLETLAEPQMPQDEVDQENTELEHHHVQFDMKRNEVLKFKKNQSPHCIAQTLVDSHKKIVNRLNQLEPPKSILNNKWLYHNKEFESPKDVHPISEELHSSESVSKSALKKKRKQKKKVVEFITSTQFYRIT